MTTFQALRQAVEDAKRNYDVSPNDRTLRALRAAEIRLRGELTAVRVERGVA